MTRSNHDEPIAPNRLAAAPNQIGVQDITYIETKEGWLYLAAILDLYSRKIVGWAMSEHIDTTLVLKALAMALLHRDPPANLLCHSDRGVQYASGAYRAAPAQAGFIASMSRKGNCYDNAFIESFWSTLKLDLVYRTAFATRQEAQRAIFDYIEAFYNRRRSHTALGFLSPVELRISKQLTQCTPFTVRFIEASPANGCTFPSAIAHLQLRPCLGLLWRILGYWSSLNR